MLDTIRLCLRKVSLRVDLAGDKWEDRSHARGLNYFERFSLRTERLHPALRHVRVFYHHTLGQLAIEVSAPRLVFGHNINEIGPGDIPTIVKILDGVVAWSLIEGFGDPIAVLPSVADWPVQRVDLPFNFRPRRVSFTAARRGLMSLQPSRRLVAHRINDQTAYFHGAGARRRFEIAIYDKAAEARKTYPQDADKAKGLLRLEVRLRGLDTVRRAFHVTGTPTLRDVVDAAAIQRVLLEKLALLDIRPGMESVLVGFDALAQRVGHRKARVLWPFAQLRSTMPRRDAAVMLGASQETARRWDRELRRAGLYPAAVCTRGILEELIEQLQSRYGNPAETCEATSTELTHNAHRSGLGDGCGASAVGGGTPGTQPWSR